MPLPDTDHSTFAVLVGLLFALVRIIEYGLKWVSEKMGPAREPPVLMVQLSPEVSHMLRETHSAAQDMKKIIDRTDSDGIPMVYTPRTQGDTIAKVSNVVQRIDSEIEQVKRSVESVEKNSQLAYAWIQNKK